MIHIFTDGSSSRQRKSIGSAYAIFNQEKKLTKSKGYGFFDKQGRNGIAELLAVYCVLIQILTKQKCNNKDIVIYSDAQYVVNELTIWFRNQMAKNFFNTKNKDIIIYLLYLLMVLKEEKNCSVKFKWVRGHQIGESFEIQGNNLVDKLAVEAHDESKTKLKDVEELIAQIRDYNTKENILELIKKYYL